MTGYQAAMGVVQCDKLDSIIERKRLMASRYHRGLSGIPGLGLPIEREWARHVYWMYGILVKPTFGMDRNALAKALSARGVESRTFFCPMNLQPFLRKLPGFPAAGCPVAERLWEQGLYLPSSQTLGEAEVAQVCSAIREIQEKGA
jgi:perosamine synthetase